jgi:hypothetical protein
VRLDQFGDMGHPIDRMSHKHNMTVPGVLGYRPQKTDGAEDFDRIGDPSGSNPYFGLGDDLNYETDQTLLNR